MNINLDIERLVLDGIDIASGQRNLLYASVTAELTRLFENGGLAGHLVAGGTLPKLSTRGVQLTDNKPRQLGQQIAQSVYGRIGRE